MPTPSKAGLKEHEVQYSQIGTGQWLPKMVAALEAGTRRMSPSKACRGGALSLSGPPLEVTDLVEKLAAEGRRVLSRSPLMPSCTRGRPTASRTQVSPWPLVTRLDILEAAKVDPPRPGMNSIEVCKKAAEATQTDRLWHVPGAGHGYR